MGEFPNHARISARIHEKEKDKLRKSGYNARHAIEYFNKISLREIDALSIDEFFLNKELEDLKMKEIALEMKLEKIQKRKDELYQGNLSKLRIDSYQKVISLYADYSEAFDANDSKRDSLEEFVEGKLIQKTIIDDLGHLECPMDEYVKGLLDYYRDVILVGRTA